MRIQLKKSKRKNKKYKIIFYDEENNDIETVHFGASGMEDFTTHKDKERKQRFLNRFKNLINKNKNNPLSPMTLSHLILWNKPDLNESLKDYAKRFNFIIL